jgi:hypothetical protein
MKLTGWSRGFENYQAITDVPARVRKTETWYWCSFAVGVALLLAGLGLMTQSATAIAGLFLAVCGVVDIALVKLWAHIRLATYQIILEIQAREKV